MADESVEISFDLGDLERDLSQLDKIFLEREEDGKDNFYVLLNEVVKKCFDGISLNFSKIDLYIKKFDTVSVQSEEDKKIKILIKNILILLKKQAKLFQLIDYVSKNIDLIIDGSSDKKREFLRKSITYYKKIKSNKEASLSADTDELIKKIDNVLSAKLHEINIKIEENQRMLHRFLDDKMRFEEDIKENILEDDYFSTKGMFLRFKLQGKFYVIKNELVLNKYKLSPTKAKKLAQKTLIKLGQLTSMFGDPLKGMTGKLQEVPLKELKNINLYPLKIVPIKLNKKLKWVLIVDITNNKYGAIFVEEVYDELVEGEISEGFLKVEDTLLEIVDPLALWKKQQEDSL
ncbi:hypothetical protein [Desulfonauticus submarinus]